MGAFDDVVQGIIKERDQLKKDKKKLEKIISSYHIQFEAAMEAQSLGLCKRVIKHALEDEKEIRRRRVRRKVPR